MLDKKFQRWSKETRLQIISVSVALIKRWYLILCEARDLIKTNNIDFALADINCSLGFRY